MPEPSAAGWGGRVMDPGFKIMLVEEEPSVQLAMEAIASDEGHQLFRVAEGGQALAAFDRIDPDLVVCDLWQPGGEGMVLFDHVIKHAPQTPVIVVTQHNRVSDAVLAMRQGAWDYLIKPVVDRTLIGKVLHRGLERARLARENAEYRSHLEHLNLKLNEALERLREDEEAGRSMQQRLLPPTTLQLNGFTFDYRLFTSSYLSGDFIDFFPIGDHHIGFYIADVSGHGAASAIVTAMLKALFERHLSMLERSEVEIITDPSHMLERLNQEFCQLSLEKYVVMFYGVLDRRDHKLRYCSAGQFPYPLLKQGGKLQSLTRQDRPVGFSRESVYTTHVIDLEPRFRLLLISDGFFELLPPDSAQNRMAGLLKELEKSDLSVEFLLEYYDIEEQAELPDDMTFFTLTGGGEG